jgi:hypothetical protein
MMIRRPILLSRRPRTLPAKGLSAIDYLRLAEECMSLAALTKDPERAAELIKTGDDYLRRAAQLISDQRKGG